MRLIVCDTEVFAYDYLAVFYDVSRNHWTVLPNDPVGIHRFLSQTDCIFVGFNVKHYDQFILRAIATGASPEQVKEINDFIIVLGRQGWEHHWIRNHRFDFAVCDLADDTQVGTSLKSIEAHLGLNIEETEVDFNLNRPLTKEEMERTIRYCHNDVAVTAKLLTIRKGYLQGKIDVCNLKQINATKALSMTNAKVTAAFLEAKAQPRYDERNYRYPPNLRLDRVPPEALMFFDTIHTDIPGEVLFKTKQELVVGGCPCTIAWGGAHGALTSCVRESREDYIILNFDVASLYPSLMIYCGYISRNIPDPAIFEDVYHTRLKAKASGDKQLANTLKLILNTAYGATLNSYNQLFDPLMARSVCISGQLFMLDLVGGYLECCKTIEILQINTDGVMFGIHPDEKPLIEAVNAEWEQRTHFMLEEDRIQRYVARDVNTYILRYANGKIKRKGWLTWGIPGAGAFKINNDFVVVKEAVCAYLLDGIPIEETIMACTDIHKFQMIAKAGGGYKAVYTVPADFEERKKHWQFENRYRVVGQSGKPIWRKPPFRWEHYDGPRRRVQKVNRVYASCDPNKGALVKVKPDGTVGKIGDLPDSCLIDNKNTCSLADIDRSWYIRRAEKAVSAFLPSS